MVAVTEPADGVWRLDLGWVNAYLVHDDVVVLVDAGKPGDPAAIRAGVREAGLEMADVDRVLVTHYDFDHVGALSALAPDLDATVVAGERDAAMLAGDRRPPLSNHKGALQRVSELALTRPALPVEGIADRETVGSFTAVHTPGHSPGHVAYVSESLGVAITGDLAVESGGVLRPPPWVINYDSARVRESLRTLAAEAPPLEVVCPGHGEPITGDVEDALSQAASRWGLPV